MTNFPFFRAYWWPGMTPILQPPMIHVLHPTPEELARDVRDLLHELKAAIDEHGNIHVAHARGVVNRKARRGGKILHHHNGRVAIIGQHPAALLDKMDCAKLSAPQPTE